jgi:lipopolysaccharide transport system permease protein
LHTLLSYLFPWRHAGLIGQFVRREVDARYRQSWLGMFWLVATPLLMLGVYTLVFRGVFKLRWSAGVEGGDLAFALRLYAGLAVFNYFGDCVGRSPGLIVNQAYLVKKVVFPVEVLAWVNAMSGLVHLGVALALLLVFGAWSGAGLPVTALALPLVWLPLLPLCVGLGWWLSGVGTYVRDVGQLLGMVLSVMLFLSPIFFPVEALPAAVRPWMFLNPLALTITQTREVLLDGVWPQWQPLAMQLIASCVIAGGGAAFFHSVRKGFADVV